MVIPFRCAVFLKEKGVKQQSLFYWVKTDKGVKLAHHWHAHKLITGETVPDETIPDNFYSAFLTDELSIILEDGKPFKLYEADIRCRYRDSFCKRDFMYVYSFGSVLVDAFMRHEEETKMLRDKQPKQAPQSNSRPHGNIR